MIFYYYNGTAWTALAGAGSGSWDHVAIQNISLQDFGLTMMVEQPKAYR